MTFTQLLEAQRELNSHLSRKPTQEELELAIIDEIGELTKALKWGADTPIPYPGWAWWQREDKPRSSAAEVLGECVDVMHFLLSGYILAGENPEYLEKAFNFLLSNPDKGWQPDVNYCLRRLPEDFEGAVFHSHDNPLGVEPYAPRIYGWVLLLRAFGFTREDFNVAWHQSVEKNLRRWG